MSASTVVQAIGQLNFEGNITPHTWYQHLTYPNGKPHVNAIIILSDILYWYRPTITRNERTGHITSSKKRFAEDKLQRSYTQISEFFGLSKKQARDAVTFLVDNGIITKELRNIQVKTGMKLSQVMYLEPVISKLKEINLPVQVIGGALQVTPDALQVTEDIPVSHTYTESTTQSTTDIKEIPPDGDYLAAVVATNGHKDTPTSYVKDQFFGYSDTFLQLYQQKMEYNPGLVEREAIEQLSLADGADPQIWKVSLTAARLNWSGQSKVPPIQRVIDVYKHGHGDYEKFKAWAWPSEAVQVPTLPRNYEDQMEIRGNE